MLMVNTQLGRSQIHGIGLFASEAIKKGTVVWRFQYPFDRKWPADYVYTLPDIAQAYVAHYCALLRDDTYLVTGDNDRFWNHSSTPNCLTDKDATQTVALRDIQEGEELTEDYGQYCDDFDASYMDIKDRETAECKECFDEYGTVACIRSVHRK